MRHHTKRCKERVKTWAIELVHLADEIEYKVHPPWA
jgi:hypothetical protein